MNKEDDLSKVICNELLRQNPMLETVDGSNLYDEYDNKFYDIDELSRVVLKALIAQEEGIE